MGKNLLQSDQNALKCVIHVSRTIDNQIIPFNQSTWKTVCAAATYHGRADRLAESMRSIPTSCIGFHMDCFKVFTNEWMCQYMASSNVHNPNDPRVFQRGLSANARPQSFVPRPSNYAFEQNHQMVVNLQQSRTSFGAGPSQIPQRSSLTQLSSTEIDNILRPHDSHYSRSETVNSFDIDLIRKHLALLPISIVQNGNTPTMNDNIRNGNSDVSNIQNIPPIHRYIGNDSADGDSSRPTVVSRVNEYLRHSEVAQHPSCHVLSAVTPRPFVNSSIRQPATVVTSLQPTVGSTNQLNSSSLRVNQTVPIIQPLPSSNNNPQITQYVSPILPVVTGPTQVTSIVNGMSHPVQNTLRQRVHVRMQQIINNNSGIPASSNWRDHGKVSNAVSMVNPVGHAGAVLNNSLINNSSRSMVSALLPDITTETSTMTMIDTNSLIQSSTQVSTPSVISSICTSVNPTESTVNSLNKNCRNSRVMPPTVTPVEQIVATNTASRNNYSTPISSTNDTFGRNDTSPMSTQRDNHTNTCSATTTIVQSVSSLRALLDHQTLVISSIQNINNRTNDTVHEGNTMPTTVGSNQTGGQSTIRINDTSLGENFIQSLFLDVDVEKWISPFLTPEQRDLFFKNDTLTTESRLLQDNVNTKGVPPAAKMRRFLDNLRERIRSEFINVRRKVLNHVPDGTFADLEHAEKPLYEYISSKIHTIKKVLNALSAEGTSSRPVTSTVTTSSETINTNNPTPSIRPDSSANEVIVTSSVKVPVVHSSCSQSSAIGITAANTPPKVVVSSPSVKSTTVTSSVNVSVPHSPCTQSSTIGISATNTRPEETISPPSDESSVPKIPDKENLIVKLPFTCKVGKKADSSRHLHKSLEVSNEPKVIESNDMMKNVDKTVLEEDLGGTVIHSDDNYFFVLRNGKVQVIPKSANDKTMEKDESDSCSELCAVDMSNNEVRVEESEEPENVDKMNEKDIIKFNPQNTYSLNEYETAVAQDDLDHLRTMLLPSVDDNDQVQCLSQPSDDQRPSTPCGSLVETCNNIDFYCNLEMPPVEVVDFRMEPSEKLSETSYASVAAHTEQNIKVNSLPSLSDRIKARNRVKNDDIRDKLQGKVVKIPLKKIKLKSNYLTGKKISKFRKYYDKANLSPVQNHDEENFMGTKRKLSPNKVNESNKYMGVNKKQKLHAERRAIRKKKRQFRDDDKSREEASESDYIRIFAGKAAVELERRDLLKLDLHPRVVVEDYFHSSNFSISFSSNNNMSCNNSSLHSDTDVSSDEDIELNYSAPGTEHGVSSDSQPIVNKQKLERLRRICNSRSSMPDR